METKYNDMKEELGIDEALKMSDEEEPDPYICKNILVANCWLQNVSGLKTRNTKTNKKLRGKDKTQ